jgi:hypothetical protein
MGVYFHILLGQSDNVHRAGTAPGAKTGGYVLLFAELQAWGLVLMERAMGFALLVHLDAQEICYVQDGKVLL